MKNATVRNGIFRLYVLTAGEWGSFGPHPLKSCYFELEFVKYVKNRNTWGKNFVGTFAVR